MIVEELLPRLKGVRRTSRGYLALCDAHPDKSPSLSVHEGTRGILLRCFAGCTLEEICTALGLHPRDLFYDRAPDLHRSQQRQREHRQREAVQHKQGRLIDACREAEQFINSRVRLDISQWSSERSDRELRLLGDAYHLLEHDPYATH